ncbi:PAAR-like domain-containing protein [Vibrio marisflavi]|uniref:Tox-PAAR-like domain-containing protein n=1 Tax=Vibrio marisflavi CECT 7928 TaxID=634439 RepID=A0ABM8ZYT9_9VIBR|nr:PAAR-like domain-containing protein [Vibrio marisflavi]CAH0536127.1 hypothetical protein VMF7928_00221 [Vibrio marisflavi CECT 7928]
MPGFAITAGGSVTIATPDVTAVPSPTGPLPMVGANMASSAMSIPPTTVLNVLVNGMPATNQMTMTATSMSTSPPVAMGVASGCPNDMGSKNMQGSITTMMGNAPVVSMCNVTAQNGLSPNSVGMHQASTSNQTVLIQS